MLSNHLTGSFSSKLATASAYLVLISQMVPSLREVGVETYKQLGATVLEVDANSHTQMLVVFSGDDLDVLEDGHLD